MILIRSLTAGACCAVLASSAFAQGANPAQAAALPGTARVFDVRAYGAKGDSTTLDTDAINRAIAAAAAAGGGTVYFGPGTYSSFSICLQSNVGLYLDHGATLLAASPTDRPENVGYDPAEPAPNRYEDYGHRHWHNSLIWGENIHDVSIMGPGRIDGLGLSRSINRETPRWGNKSIALKNVRGVILRDFSIYRGGHFGVLATGVDNFTVDNLTIDTNRDGIDVDDCRNVRITNTSVNSPYDDAIVFKTSYALAEVRATENVELTNSFVSGFTMGSVLDGTYRPLDVPSNQDGPTGRVKLGTESNGPFRNITISNVVFDHARGLALETVDGSQLEDITISNITMRHVYTSPLFLRLGARLRGPKESTAIGSFRRVTISNVVASDADPRYASTITGLPGHDIQDVRLSNIRIQYRGGMNMQQVAEQPATMTRQPSGGHVGPRSPYDVPDQANVYPEPSMFGLVPASGFYIRHVDGLTMDGIDISFAQPDTRPVFVLQDVNDARFEDVTAPKVANVPTFVLRDVHDLRTIDVRPVGDRAVREAADTSF